MNEYQPGSFNGMNPSAGVYGRAPGNTVALNEDQPGSFNGINPSAGVYGQTIGNSVAINSQEPEPFSFNPSARGYGQGSVNLASKNG